MVQSNRSRNMWVGFEMIHARLFTRVCLFAYPSHEKASQGLFGCTGVQIHRIPHDVSNAAFRRQPSVSCLTLTKVGSGIWPLGTVSGEGLWVTLELAKAQSQPLLPHATCSRLLIQTFQPPFLVFY